MSDYLRKCSAFIQDGHELYLRYGTLTQEQLRLWLTEVRSMCASLHITFDTKAYHKITQISNTVIEPPCFATLYIVIILWMEGLVKAKPNYDQSNIMETLMMVRKDDIENIVIDMAPERSPEPPTAQRLGIYTPCSDKGEKGTKPCKSNVTHTPTSTPATSQAPSRTVSPDPQLANPSSSTSTPAEDLYFDTEVASATAKSIVPQPDVSTFTNLGPYFAKHPSVFLTGVQSDRSSKITDLPHLDLKTIDTYLCNCLRPEYKKVWESTTTSGVKREIFYSRVSIDHLCLGTQTNEYITVNSYLGELIGYARASAVILSNDEATQSHSLKFVAQKILKLEKNVDTLLTMATPTQSPEINDPFQAKQLQVLTSQISSLQQQIRFLQQQPAQPPPSAQLVSNPFQAYLRAQAPYMSPLNIIPQYGQPPSLAFTPSYSVKPVPTSTNQYPETSTATTSANVQFDPSSIV